MRDIRRRTRRKFSPEGKIRIVLEGLRGEQSVFDVIANGEDIIKVGRRDVPSRAYVASSNFKGPDQQKLVGALSGGERNRVHLATLLKSGGNVLLLDDIHQDPPLSIASTDQSIRYHPRWTCPRF